MPEWLYEAGIGEERAILVDGGIILRARIEWDEGLRPGHVAETRLVAKAAGRTRGTVRFPGGEEAWIDALPREVSEGALLMARVTRSALAERGRNKLAQARPAPGEAARPAPALLQSLREGANPVRTVRAGDGTLEAHGWDALLEEAHNGVIGFPGGSLIVSPTSAMTLIDVDGTLPPRALALAAVPAIVAALGRLDIGGSVGIDFPSLALRADRQAVNASLGQALAGWRGERTAMNGFGFVQLVARLERPSLVARLQQRPIAAAARMLLRQAERVPPGGRLLLVARPEVRAGMRDAWLEELSRRTGRAVSWREDPTLATHGGYAQAIGA
jgi:hypothetical protein